MTFPLGRPAGRWVDPPTKDDVRVPVQWLDNVCDVGQPLNQHSPKIEYQIWLHWQWTRNKHGNKGDNVGSASIEGWRFRNKIIVKPLLAEQWSITHPRVGWHVKTKANKMTSESMITADFRVDLITMCQLLLSLRKYFDKYEIAVYVFAALFPWLSKKHFQILLPSLYLHRHRPYFHSPYNADIFCTNHGDQRGFFNLKS